jgi:opacity protein-like surface antigen
MTKTWLSTVAAVALLVASSAAFAADLGRPAPAAAPIIMPIYNWTGFYIGANLGGAWASGTLTDNLTGASFTGNHSGVIGGGTLGYNWQVSPNFVVGFEGTFDGTSIGNTSNIVSVPILGTPTAIQGSIGTNWVSTLAARFGIAVNNVLYYAKGGGGWADNSASLTNTITGASVSASNTRSGWLVGGGIEYAVSPNWTIKAEYDYLGLSNWTNSGPLSPVDTFNISRQINVFTVGVNYKFY